jgi:hypothetical protein
MASGDLLYFDMSRSKLCANRSIHDGRWGEIKCIGRCSARAEIGLRCSGTHALPLKRRRSTIRGLPSAAGALNVETSIAQALLRSELMVRVNFYLGFRAAARVTSLACPREVTKRRAPCLAPMLRIGSLRGSGRKRASRKLASLKHPAVYSAYGLHCSALRPRACIQASSLALAQGYGFWRSD